MDIASLGLEFVGEMMQKDPNIIKNRYNIDIQNKSKLQVFEEICQKRGFIGRGREVDYERGAIGILDDFRKGRLGKITLDERK